MYIRFLKLILETDFYFRTCLNYENCESKGGVNMGSCANGNYTKFLFARDGGKGCPGRVGEWYG